MRFIHTADLHLGKAFMGIGDKGDRLREAQLLTLERIVELAKTEMVDFVVIAGDLFDSNEVTRKLVRKVVDRLAGLAPMPVLILPGTHDLLDEGSVFRRSEFVDAENVRVFGVDVDSIKVGNTAVHGRANDTKQGGVHPLSEMSPNSEADHNIAVLHASIEIESKASPDDYLVSPAEIASCGMDYVALGHWHSKNDFSSGGVIAWYCGAPEPTKFDEADGAGNVLLVELTDKNVDVKVCPTGQYAWIEKSFDVATSKPGGPLESEIKALGGEKVLLRVSLKGVLPRGEEIDVGALEEELEDDFFHLEIKNAGIGYPLEDIEGLFPEGTIGSIYVARLKVLIDEAEDEEQKSLLEEALYLGSSYISGELEVS